MRTTLGVLVMGLATSGAGTLFAATPAAPATKPGSQNTIVLEEGAAASPAQPLSKTVGIRTISRKVNADGSLTLRYRWKDNKLNKEIERDVIVNEETVIGIGGKFSKLSDVTDQALRDVSVATVGPDNVAAISLRIGRPMIQVSGDQLTPKQRANLEAAAPKPTAASDAALEKRVDGLVAALKLDNPEKETKLKAVLTEDLKGVRESHNAGFAPAPDVRANLNKGLKELLTPEQIESLKDALTSNNLQHTFDAYHLIVPELTPEHDKFILATLKEAREDALDVKNPDELGRVFEPYKTKIEKYITAQGYDWHTYYGKYQAEQRAKKQGTTQPN